MLTLAAYRLETPDLSEEALNHSWEKTLNLINEWLIAKGVDDVNQESGDFDSETKGHVGSFSRTQTSSASGHLTEITLKEPANDGGNFITNVAIAKADSRLTIFLTLSATISGDLVAPMTIYPRCPKLIRDLLSMRNDWTFGGSDIPPAEPIQLAGKDAASTLVGYLMNEDRTLPVTVVSELDGEPVWQDLPEKLAVDLAGLSSVIQIDSQGSWELNRRLGKSRSCYLGAVRIYWPLKDSSQDPSNLRTNLWTAEKLLSNDSDEKGVSRFTTTLRRKVMSVAALSVDAPQ